MKQRLRKVKIIQLRLKEFGPGIKPYGASQVVVEVKNLSASARNVRDTDSISGLGRSPGGGRGNPLQYSCLENPTDRGAWQATVDRVAKSQIRLSD